jgi:hypothetical protein
MKTTYTLIALVTLGVATGATAAKKSSLTTKARIVRAKEKEPRLRF